MRLSEYLSRAAETYGAFAARTGITTASVSRIARGIQRPNWDTIAAIEKATSGKVTANDLAPVPAEAER